MTVTLDRLRSSGDIAAALRGRRQRGGRLAVVYVVNQGGPGSPRLAVVASRRVGTAVHRNRAKRLLREAARQLRWRPGSDVVLVAKAPCASSRLAAVRDEIMHLASSLDALETEA